MKERDFLQNCGYCPKKEKNDNINFKPGEKKLDIRAVIAQLDALFAVEDIDGAGNFLNERLLEARKIGDKTGELSILSELMGFHRRTADAEAALRACYEGIDLIAELGIGSSISGATVMLNAATTLAAYGRPSEAIPLFEEVARVYSANLDPSDYRFSGLYNNLGTAHVSAENYEAALPYYEAALALSKKADNKPEIAVTHVNIAELYARQGADGCDDAVDLHVKAALAALEENEVRDGYYAFTCRKCAPTLAALGYFFDAKKLNERADRIYAGN